MSPVHTTGPSNCPQLSIFLIGVVHGKHYMEGRLGRAPGGFVAGRGALPKRALTTSNPGSACVPETDQRKDNTA